MIVGNRIRAIREQKSLTQIDLAVRTHLLREFLARVENGEVVPDVPTLERIATALDVPLHRLFYDGDEVPELPNLPKRKTANDIVSDGRRKDRK